MSKLENAIETVSVPIVFLNLFGGIVSGIWLAFLGQWRLIIIGLALLFMAHWVLSLLMLPGMLLGFVTAYFHEKKNPLAYVVGLSSQVYTNLLIVGTCAFAFYVCTSSYEGTGKLGLIPYLLWSWGMALGPWQFFASKEQDNVFSFITLFSATVFYLLILISAILGPWTLLIVTALFLCVQLVVVPVFNLYYAANLEERAFYPLAPADEDRETPLHG